MRHPLAAPLPAPAARRAAVALGALIATCLLATGPARAQAAATPADPPSSPGGPSTLPEVVKPRTAGPGDSSAGIIRPGPAGDPGMPVRAPAAEAFPTPVIRPQTLQRDGAPVVPK